MLQANPDIVHIMYGGVMADLANREWTHRRDLQNAHRRQAHRDSPVRNVQSAGAARAHRAKPTQWRVGSGAGEARAALQGFS